MVKKIKYYRFCLFAVGARNLNKMSFFIILLTEKSIYSIRKVVNLAGILIYYGRVVEIGL